MAEAQAMTVAAAIAAEILGEPAPGPFDGRGYCFLETGLSESALIKEITEPEPSVRVGEVSAAYHVERSSSSASTWFAGSAARAC